MQPMPDMQTLMRLASSPAGKQLLALLQNSGGNNLNSAISAASEGNFEQAKTLLSSTLSSPDARNLLKQLEEEL